MSSKDNNKQVSAAVRILQQKRDASARATHLMVKNDSLITYEKSFEGQAAVKKFFIATFLERKIMSTKTSFKRIALVAVSALAIGGFSAVSPASAAEGDITVTAAYNTTAGSQVVGGTITMTFEGVIPVASPSTYTISSSGVGSIGSATITAGSSETTAGALYLVGTTTAATFPTTGLDYKAAIDTAGADTQTVTLRAQSSVAGVQTITVTKKDSNGTPTNTYTETLTWIAATATGMSATGTSVALVTGACPTLTGATAAADAAQYAAASVSSAFRGEVVHVCASARDANNNPVVLATTSTVIHSLGGTVAAVTATNGTSVSKIDYSITTGAVATGASTATVILIDIYGNVVSKSLPLTVYGSLKTLALANAGYAAQYGGSATLTAGTVTTPADWTTGTGVAGAATSALGLIAITAKDANGSVIDLLAAGQGNSVALYTVDSDATAGAPAAATSDSAGATVAINTDAAGDDQYLVVNCSGSTKAEKLTITLHGRDSAAALVTSNSVTFYCSDETSKVAVTPSTTSADANGSITANVSITDASGYPVPDGTAVTMAASNGGVIAGGDSTTTNGAFTNAKNVFVGNGGDTSIAAYVGSKSGTATVAVAGGAGETSSLALDAANAATDAANNAYDEAQNATQAASDALAAVTALAAQVKSLIASVKKLTSAVAKLKK
jgi:hypothetical protein